MNQNQSKGTGKLVGGIFAGIGAAFNLFLAFIFGMVGAIYAADPASVDVNVNGIEYSGEKAIEVAKLASKIGFGIAVVTGLIGVALIVLCVKLVKDYKKQSALYEQAKRMPYGAMGYNQYQANPYQNQYQNPYAQPQYQAQNPYAQNMYQNPQAGYQAQPKQPQFQGQQPQFQAQPQNPVNNTGYNTTQNQ